jgi:hypothetical protein
MLAENKVGAIKQIDAKPMIEPIPINMPLDSL